MEAAALGETVLDSRPATSSRVVHAPRGSTPRFEPIRMLGRGGVGEVTLARDNDIGRSVAVKRLRSDIDSEQLVARFVDEIRTVGTLEHPNIAAIHDAGIDADGRHYFVMPYVDGETLEMIIAKLAAGDAEYHRRFPFEVRVQIMLGILHAIRYAHAKGILHRDIKPSNIMVGPYGEVVMMDWGIAKRLEAVEHPGNADEVEANEDDRVFRTRHGTLIGTPAYMSPEQACGDIARIDARSDTYSLAAVFYELVTLQHYLAGHRTMSDMLAAVIAKPHIHAAQVASPHQLPIPAELGWFIENGLAKDPAQRYQSTGAMLDALLAAMAGSFRVQCFVTLMKRGGVSTLRYLDVHPIRALLAGVATAALAAVGIATLVGWII